MNSLERIHAALAGTSADRRAIAPVLSLYGARLTGCPLVTYYADPVAYARGQAAVRETFQPDALYGPFDFPGVGAAFGSELHEMPEHAPNLRRPAIRTLAEWDRLVLPDPDTHPRLLYLREAIRLMAAEHHGQVAIAACIMSPIDLPTMIMGMDAWMELVLFNPAGANRVMERLVPFFVQLANGLLAAGATCLAMPCAFASPANVTRDIAANFARPVLVGALAQLRGPVLVHHGGAPLLAHLDLLAGLPAAVAFVMDERDDLTQARRIVGPGPVLFGGPMGPRLPGLTVAQIKAQCRAMLEECRADARFALCTGGPDVPWHTPPENIHALRQAAEAFGGNAT